MIDISTKEAEGWNSGFICCSTGPFTPSGAACGPAAGAGTGPWQPKLLSYLDRTAPAGRRNWPTTLRWTRRRSPGCWRSSSGAASSPGGPTTNAAAGTWWSSPTPDTRPPGSGMPPAGDGGADAPGLCSGRAGAVCRLPAPGPAEFADERGGCPMGDLKRLARCLGPYRRDLFLGAFLILVETVFELIIPVLMADLIDVGVAQRDVPLHAFQGCPDGPVRPSRPRDRPVVRPVCRPGRLWLGRPGTGGGIRPGPGLLLRQPGPL